MSRSTVAFLMAYAIVFLFAPSSKAASAANKPAVNRARPPEPLDPQKTLTELGNQDAKVRADAVSKMNDSLAMTFNGGPGKVKAVAFESPLLKAILKAITDDDAEVRRQGFGTLNLIAHVNIWSRLKNGQIDPNANVAVDLSGEPGIRAAIIQHLDDPNWEVRKFAIYALGLGYSPSADTEKTLLGRWKAENARSVKDDFERIKTDQAREAIAEGLRAGHYNSKDAIDTLMQMLDDKKPGIQAVAAVDLSELKVRDAIPKIVSKLRKGEPYAKQGAAQALGNYGEAAKEYVPELEQIAGNSEEPVKQQLNTAIKKIKESKKSE